MPTGPYRIRKIIKMYPFTLGLAQTMWNPIFIQVSQLDHNTPLDLGKSSSEPHPVTVDDLEEGEV